MHILFVDDSPSTSLPVIAFLQQQGYRVTYVENAHMAVEAFQVDPPDLVLMDVVMSDMDGIEATRRIKALGGARWVPVMLMTGLSAKEDIVNGFNAGADDYLIKPIVFEVLEARMRSMQRIAVMQDSLYAILDNVYEGIITIDEMGSVQSFNKAAEQIFEYTPSEVVGRNIKMLMPSPYSEEHDGYLARYMREGAPRVIGIGRKVRGQRKSGQTFPMRLSVTEVVRSTGRLFIGLVSDISKEELARERIEFLALHDPLTSLPNRAHFNDALDAVFGDLDGKSHAVLFIDLDGFKPINDTLGHEAGDEALRIVARRLRGALAESDFVARLGGDEFVAIARDVTDTEAARAIGERLLTAISEPMSLHGHESRMGASIGVALIPEHGSAATDILTAADNAMYMAKRTGKGRVVMVDAISNTEPP